MIPRNLEERHILEAVSHIDSKGVPWQRRSVHYHVVIDGKCYPPKYLISLANLFASGIEHSSYDFNAIEAENYFLARGYRILDRRKTVVIPLVSEDDELEYPAPIKMRQFIFTHPSGPVPRHAVLGVGGVQ